MAFFNHLPGKKKPKSSFSSQGFFKEESKGFGNKKQYKKQGTKSANPKAQGSKRMGRKPSFAPQEPVLPTYLKYEYESKKPQAPVAPVQEFAVQDNENLLVGRNPIREAIKSGRSIEKILVHKGEVTGSAVEIVARARQAKITVQEVEKKRLDQIAPHHQGMIAFASAYEYHDLDDILALAESKGEAPFIVMLDGVTDPHNLGAIIRSAECAGAHGVIIPSRRSAGLTATAVKASAGAVEHIMVAKVTNLNGVIESLKRKGLWVYAADMQGESYKQVDFSGPCLLVIGSEGDGVSSLVLENADKKVSIPMKGNIDSLNASVAAGILLFEIANGR